MFIWLCQKIVLCTKKVILPTYIMFYGVMALNAAADSGSARRHTSFIDTTISAIMSTVAGMDFIHDEELLTSACMRLAKLAEQLKCNEGLEGMLLLKKALLIRCCEKNSQNFEKMLHWVNPECVFLENLRESLVEQLLLQKELFTAKVMIPRDIFVLQEKGWTRDQLIKESLRAVTEARELKKNALRDAASRCAYNELGQEQNYQICTPFMAKKMLFPRAKSPLGQQIESIA